MEQGRARSLGHDREADGGRAGGEQPDRERIEDRLCVTLYRASHAMTGAYRQLLEPLGLTYPQYTVLSVLWRTNIASVGELGQILGADHNTMSPMIKRLEAKSLVQKRRHHLDEREVVVELTEDGRQLAKRADGIQTTITAATGLSATDRAGLVAQLQELRERMQAFNDPVL